MGEPRPDPKTGVDYVTDRIDRHIKENPPPELRPQKFKARTKTYDLCFLILWNLLLLVVLAVALRRAFP